MDAHRASRKKKTGVRQFSGKPKKQIKKGQSAGFMRLKYLGFAQKNYSYTDCNYIKRTYIYYNYMYKYAYIHFTNN